MKIFLLTQNKLFDNIKIGIVPNFKSKTSFAIKLFKCEIIYKSKKTKERENEKLFKTARFNN